MPIVIEDLPRDSNGIVQGAWRILHESQHFHGDIGAYTMRHGASTEPAYGRPLLRAVAAYGPEIYLEPWGELPPGFYCGEMVAHPVPATIPWRVIPCPWKAGDRVHAALADTLKPPPPEEPKEVAASVVTEAPAADELVAGALNNVADEDLEALTAEELRAIAEELGVEIDGRWGERRLIREIRNARG